MKIVIDSQVVANSTLSTCELLLILASSKCKVNDVLEDMCERGLIVFNGSNNPIPSSEALREAHRIILDSDKSIPKEDELKSLVEKLREIFPKGKKPGSNKFWRGNTKDVTLKLKKFFKLYGNEYSHEEIIEATKRYVESFNGNYTYMRVLDYFIHKYDLKTNGDGEGYRQDISELASWLENKDTTEKYSVFDELV